MAGNAVRQFEKLAQEIFLHLPKKFHIDRGLTAAQRTQKADRHKITELVTRGVAATRIIHIESHALADALCNRFKNQDMNAIFEYGLHEFISDFLRDSAALGRQIEIDYRFSE